MEAKSTSRSLENRVKPISRVKPLLMYNILHLQGDSVILGDTNTVAIATVRFESTNSSEEWHGAVAVAFCTKGHKQWNC